LNVKVIQKKTFCQFKPECITCAEHQRKWEISEFIGNIYIFKEVVWDVLWMDVLDGCKCPVS